MKLFNGAVVALAVLFSALVNANEGDGNIAQITENIMKVCDKPENAGSYWDIKVSSDGEADIKLKLADIGVTGEAAFSKVEWDGIQKTVEDNKDYRECVKDLAPIFVKKFGPKIPKPQTVQEKTRRVLGGVKWQELGAGLKVTLSSCYRQSSSVVCEFIANSMESDSSLNIFDSSAVYDQKGHKYTPSQITVANFKKTFSKSYTEDLYGELVKGVDTLVKAKFSNVNEDAVLVSKAMLVTKITQDGSKAEKQTFAFRNVKIALR
ncbi:MAG: hypothetical protein D6B28_04865 [Gammaproteobacteria bacterium]|nr:MAG: hypothetical protein D6B28_04865 [Gammaproteobacteria bacterium]